MIKGDSLDCDATTSKNRDPERSVLYVHEHRKWRFCDVGAHKLGSYE